jgi:NADH-quinone oxidoreductase subunit M
MGISLFLVLLTTFLITLCLLTSWDTIKFNIKRHLISFLVMGLFLIGVGLYFRFITFLYFFESVLIFILMMATVFFNT